MKVPKRRFLWFLTYIFSVLGKFSRHNYVKIRPNVILTIGVKRPFHYITLNSEARADLAAWLTFIDKFNDKSCFLFDEWVSSDIIKLYTDAAGGHGGFAAVLGNQWFYGEWKPDMRQYHITVKGIVPLYCASD